MRGSRSRESFFCLEQQGKPPVGKKFVLDLEGRVGFAKPKICQAKEGQQGHSRQRERFEQRPERKEPFTNLHIRISKLPSKCCRNAKIFRNGSPAIIPGRL